ncbi:MAG TPA: SRPBCC domain-containing protein [Edaphobacter sp.]|uniref:SRPBCC family protein n=1 Tax=Edaphobacter sp. TaxID=1934404 RepID=UPI002C603761|nr:SRPBCC domain-containing protein [Edaphobacter sp.]HUZ95945.1 SRPBCC domain-containing protein [Edaphobacter sp.]
MNQSEEQTRSVVIEKIFAHAPEKLWRALTEPALLTQWLLSNDFLPEIGREFQFKNEPVGGWDGVIDCKVLALDPLQRLAYSWRAFGHESTVEFTLTPADGGTHLRMEHSGFRANQEAAYRGAQYGWQRFIENLERLLNVEVQ